MEGLQEVPKSGILWSESIDLEFRPKQISRAMLALKTSTDYISKRKDNLNIIDNNILQNENVDKNLNKNNENKKNKNEDKKIFTCSGDKDPNILNSIARIFWREGAITKARNWFRKSISADPDFGDTWIQLYKFEKEQNNLKEVEKVIEECKNADPKHGNLWCKISKECEIFLTTKEILEKSFYDVNLPTFLIEMNLK
jgi:tetratricopeptide (TPR) repeat protein